MDTKKTAFLFKAYKQQLELGSFSGSHEIFTPFELVNEMIDQIPDLHAKEAFLVMYNVEFAISLVYNYDIPPSRIHIYVDHLAKDCLAHKMRLNVVKSLEELTMKFDVVLGNPPYEGKKALHQQFFNKGVELLNDNGTICFIQPATPYFNKKDKKKAPEQLMIDNIKKYRTNVKFADSTVFEGARIQNDVAITILTKTPSEQLSATYKNGKNYDNVLLEDISITQVNPTVLHEIAEKYAAWIDKHGNLENVVTKNSSVFKASLPEIRGTYISDEDFYTFIPKVEKAIDEYKNNNYKDFGVVVNNKNEVDNVYDYLRSYVARFGLSLIKFNQHLDNKENKLVPLVDFTRTYTDKELYDMIGLTDEEVITIKSVISNYYDR